MGDYPDWVRCRYGCIVVRNLKINKQELFAPFFLSILLYLYNHSSNHQCYNKPNFLINIATHKDRWQHDYINMYREQKDKFGKRFQNNKGDVPERLILLITWIIFIWFGS